MKKSVFVVVAVSVLNISSVSGLFQRMRCIFSRTTVAQITPQMLEEGQNSRVAPIQPDEHHQDIQCDMIVVNPADTSDVDESLPRCPSPGQHSKLDGTKSGMTHTLSRENIAAAVQADIVRLHRASSPIDSTSAVGSSGFSVKQCHANKPASPKMRSIKYQNAASILARISMDDHESVSYARAVTDGAVLCINDMIHELSTAVKCCDEDRLISAVNDAEVMLRLKYAVLFNKRLPKVLMPIVGNHICTLRKTIFVARGLLQ